MNPTSSTGALAQLQQFNAGTKSPDQILTDTQGSLGVPAAQQQVQGLRGAINQTTSLLNQVAPGVMGRTQNSLVTNAQANRQIQNEEAPIQQNLSSLDTQYSGANQDLTELERQAEAKANLAYTGQQGQQSYLQNLYNTLYKQEQDAATQAEQKRQFDIQEARLKSAGGSSNPGLDFGGLASLLGGSTSTPSVTPPANLPNLINQDIGRAFQNFQNQPAGYTEKTIIPALQQEYQKYGIDPSQLAQQIYAFRKKVGFG